MSKLFFVCTIKVNVERDSRMEKEQLGHSAKYFLLCSTEERNANSLERHEGE